MEYVNLGDVATYINGYAFKPEQRGKKGLPIIRIQDLNGNSHDLGFFDGEYPEQVEINTGDILISWSGSLGVYKWNKGKALLNQHIFKVLFNKVEIDKEYFCYAIRNSLSSMSQQTHGATMKHITKKDFDNISIPYPNSDEQKMIANNLNIVNKLIMFYEKELILFEQMVKARFIEMFGDESNPFNWPIVTVDSVADVQVGVVIKPAQYYADRINGIKTFRSLNVGEMNVKDSDWVYFSEEGNRKNIKSILKEHDLLIIRSGAPGTACVIEKQYEGCNAIDLIIAHPNKNYINPYYLCMFTNSAIGKRQIDEGTGGAAQQHFNVGKYKKMKIFYPPMDKQQEFECLFKQVDKSRFDIKKSITELEREVVYD